MHRHFAINGMNLMLCTSNTLNTTLHDVTTQKWRWRQRSPPKRYCPTMTLYCFRSEDGDIKVLRNVGILPQHCR